MSHETLVQLDREQFCFRNLLKGLCPAKLDLVYLANDTERPYADLKKNYSCC